MLYMWEKRAFCSVMQIQEWWRYFIIQLKIIEEDPDQGQVRMIEGRREDAEVPVRVATVAEVETKKIGSIPRIKMIKRKRNIKKPDTDHHLIRVLDS